MLCVIGFFVFTKYLTRSDPYETDADFKIESDPVIIPLQRCFDMRNAKVYSQKAKGSNLKELSDMANYLKANEIYTIEDLERRVSPLKDTVDELKVTMDTETARMKEMRKMPEYVSTLKELKPIVDGLQKIKFDKASARERSSIVRFIGNTSAEHTSSVSRF